MKEYIEVNPFSIVVTVCKKKGVRRASTYSCSTLHTSGKYEAFYIEPIKCKYMHRFHSLLNNTEEAKNPKPSTTEFYFNSLFIEQAKIMDWLVFRWNKEWILHHRFKKKTEDKLMKTRQMSVIFTRKKISPIWLVRFFLGLDRIQGRWTIVNSFLKIRLIQWNYPQLKSFLRHNPVKLIVTK